MAEQINNYQCPACTGPLHFVGESGMLECDYCGSKFSVQEIEALYKDKENAAVEAAAAAAAKEEAKKDESSEGEFSGGESTWGKDGEKLRTYNCPSCGAELICDENTAATSCPYCGNPTLVPANFSGGLKPDYIIPFKLDKEAAKTALNKFYKGKKFLPKSFADENHIDEIKGVYVPFWLFSGTAEADVRYNATRVNSFVRGDEKITVTDHFRVRRKGCVDFEKLPVDASTKMPDTHMDAIEPYDYRELRPFSSAYLPGFLADKYDLEISDCYDRAGEREKNTAISLMYQSVGGYTTCVPESSSANISGGKVDYALMPVWLLSTNWQGKNYLFAMNGQTGRLVGDLPIDKSRLLAWFAGIAAPLMIILGILFY